MLALTAAAAFHRPRQAPASVQNITTITTSSGATIRYKEPGKEGICETTPGVNSYSGYIDVGEDLHVFFWFFESRQNPSDDPVTLWLNGGPGSDSLIGLFEEIGPCSVDEHLETQLRGYSWSNVSNVLFLSQPVGTGEICPRHRARSLVLMHLIQGFHTAKLKSDTSIRPILTFNRRKTESLWEDIQPLIPLSSTRLSFARSRHGSSFRDSTKRCPNSQTM